ncbi:MAG: hypothetical protein COT71_01140 [Candidatus Andersenbacteria bacterium CG10_big_fil_rev_8_21_14_0_10_54_11]|uniref:Uncharacterized protein n=1 Tax=Candidatus Andersenbacteria bacterium CG10_big_fil_rev_8_21_14_0_10_54_11 TaxID=1974485 RepID=A0A2M6X005_9BACT|nr:MAG: hypothetical protein COT71_01140 [Candidatus Andersenbacteria bacterium CG10_big_fil_rev_8_21_14_0_10_54_11]
MRARGRYYRQAGRRPFLASFFTPTRSLSSSRLADAAVRPESRRQVRVQRQAAAAGALTFVGQLASSLPRTTGTVYGERRRRRRAVRKLYLKEVRRLAEARVRAERELDKQLARRQRVIAQQRGVLHVDPEDARQVRTKQFADDRYHSIERQKRKLNKKHWDEAKRDLERSRDQQYRSIYQRSRGRQQEEANLPPILRGTAGTLFRQSDAAGGPNFYTPQQGSIFARSTRGDDWRIGDDMPPAAERPIAVKDV